LLKQELEHFASIGWEAMDEFERNQGSRLGFSIAQSLWLLYDADAHSNGILTASGVVLALNKLCNATVKEQDFKTQGNADITTR